MAISTLKARNIKVTNLFGSALSGSSRSELMLLPYKMITVSSGHNAIVAYRFHNRVWVLNFKTHTSCPRRIMKISESTASY